MKILKISRTKVLFRERLDNLSQPSPIEYILLTLGDGTAARPEAAWPLAYLLLSPGPGLDWAGWAARAPGAVM